MQTKHILVVDDDAVISSVIRETLEDEGYSVELSPPQAVLSAVLEHRPDLILLDLMMPIVSGREVRRRLLANRRTAMVPVVLMSSEPRLEALAAELHVQAYLSKPFDLDDVVCIVQRQVGVE